MVLYFNFDFNNSLIIKQRSNDGYFNIIDICNIYNKNFNEWYELKTTKLFLVNLDKLINKDNNLNIRLINGTYEQVYLHPLATKNFALWISDSFSKYISEAINDWQYLTNKKYIQLLLADILNADIDVKISYFKIDLVTKRALIEINEFSNWKQAFYNMSLTYYHT